MPQTEHELQHFLKVAIDAAIQAGEILLKYWGQLSAIKEKEFSGDLVTEADQESEVLIMDILHTHFPDHAFLGEEGGAKFSGKNEYMWCVDPLDGTTNYTHQFPIFSVSIALLYHKKPIVGVVYNPITKELFHAAKGLGAYCNGTKLHVSKVTQLTKSLLVTGFPYNRRENSDNNYREFFHMTHISQGVRRLGSAALDLAYVAAGRLDGYWEKGLKPWDMAAGVIILKEAKGRVSAFDLSEFQLFEGNLLATNGLIHSALSDHLCNPYILQG
ncbi:MAG: inositol monophosphatase [Parachlamydiaceae bacterium]|nr:inositol monophosphatase [Parachlamydiaceae bacterium]